MPGKRLTLTERAQIEVLFGQGLTFPQIAAAIGRDRSTVWRELKRNNQYKYVGTSHPFGPIRYKPGVGYLPHWGGLYRWRYSHRHAQALADARARRRRNGKLRGYRSRRWNPLGKIVMGKLVERWSPTQIAAWLRSQYPDAPEWWVSHETIYQAVFYQARGGMRKEVARQVMLRSGRTHRRPQSRAAAAGRGARAWLGLNISARPAEAADRAVPGHWEGDLIIGARGSSAIITLVERSTRFVVLGALPHSRVSEQVVGVLIDLMRRVPAELRKTLTWDQGSEMARHASFSLATDTTVYFCDPHSPWQRGSNENTNGLLRQYFPRSSTDFRTISQEQLDLVARQLNTRPRQTLGWHTPAERLNEFLVATAA